MSTTVVVEIIKDLMVEVLQKPVMVEVLLIFVLVQIRYIVVLSLPVVEEDMVLTDVLAVLLVEV